MGDAVPIQENRSTSVTIDGKDFVYFGGTNYLGLSRRPELMRAANDAFEHYGFSAGASRITSGESDLLLGLESELTQFAGAEQALVVPAGYMANNMVIDAIEAHVDAAVILQNAHSSIKSPLKHWGKPVVTYTAGEPADSIRKNKGLRAAGRIVYIIEPVDPLTGELFNPGQLEPSFRDGDYLILDEAHSFGVLGNTGRGALEHFGWLKRKLQNATVIQTGTFSKAIGTYGGFILADADLISAVKQNSGGYKSSTALSPVLAAATRESLRLIQADQPNTVFQLKDNIKLLNEALVELGIDHYRDNCVPIYYLRSSPQVLKLRSELPERGIYIPSVTNYFADFCEIGLRWTIQAGHTEDHLRLLQRELAQLLPDHGRLSSSG